MDFLRILNYFPYFLIAFLISKNNFPNCLLNFFPYFLLLITFLICKNNFPYFLFLITFQMDFPRALNYFPYFLVFACTCLSPYFM
jgi:hypothetical protein